MIKINLLEPAERTKAAAGIPKLKGEGIVAPEEKKKNIIFGLIIGVALVIIAIWYFAISSKLDGLKEQKMEKEREKQRVESLIAQVEEFRATRTELQKQIDLIEELKKKQEGPADLMKRVYTAMPEQIFLNKITQKGDEVTLEGEALTRTAISNFYKALQDSPNFINVKPGKLSAEQQVVSFVLSFTFIIDPEARAKKLEEEAKQATKKGRRGQKTS